MAALPKYCDVLRLFTTEIPASETQSKFLFTAERKRRRKKKHFPSFQSFVYLNVESSTSPQTHQRPLPHPGPPPSFSRKLMQIQSSVADAILSSFSTAGLHHLFSFSFAFWRRKYCGPQFCPPRATAPPGLRLFRSVISLLGRSTATGLLHVPRAE